MKILVSDNIYKIKYPCLMKGANGLIILVTEDDGDRFCTGTCLVSPPKDRCMSFSVGYKSTTWALPALKPFEGSITLSND